MDYHDIIALLCQARKALRQFLTLHNVMIAKPKINETGTLQNCYHKSWLKENHNKLVFLARSLYIIFKSPYICLLVCVSVFVCNILEKGSKFERPKIQ